jgi:hypothetical protein
MVVNLNHIFLIFEHTMDSLVTLCAFAIVKQKLPQVDNLKIPQELKEKLHWAFGIVYKENQKKFDAIEWRWWIGSDVHPFINKNMDIWDPILHNSTWGIQLSPNVHFRDLQWSFRESFEKLCIDKHIVDSFFGEELDMDYRHYAVLIQRESHYDIVGVQIQDRGKVVVPMAEYDLSPLIYMEHLRRINNSPYLEWCGKEKCIYHQTFNNTELMQMRIPWL